MRSQRLAVATNFLPFQAVGYCAFSLVGGKRGQMPFGRATGNIKFTEQKHNVNFNPCIVRPSNARIVTVFAFTVADAAGAATLRFKRTGFLLQVENMGE